MSINLPNEIISRVKRTWDFLRPAVPQHKPLRSADPLIKMNLPPLMGRRDAAYDCAAKLFSDDLFAREEAERSRIYTIGNGLMQRAAEDTRAILRMLSSPDTESRERGILHFVLLIRNISQTLGDSLELQDELLQDESVSPLKELGVTQTEAELVQSLTTPALGGLGVAFARVAMAGRLGLEIDLDAVPAEDCTEIETLFSESNSRFVATVRPSDRAAFEEKLKGIPFACVGTVTEKPELIFRSKAGGEKHVALEALLNAYKGTLDQI